MFYFSFVKKLTTLMPVLYISVMVILVFSSFCRKTAMSSSLRCIILLSGVKVEAC